MIFNAHTASLIILKLTTGASRKGMHKMTATAWDVAASQKSPIARFAGAGAAKRSA